jgi:peptidoglycan/LPS O-acetylase OafA/YrhL
MKPKVVAERWAGIEWMRGVAAFGVICLHSGLAVHNRTTAAAGALREIFNFAVPFFLVVSFFFAVRAEKVGWRPWLQRRAERIFVPFVFWSLVYLALHVAKLVIHHQAGEMGGLFADPASLILSGGTSIALYFLPLLFTGLVLIQLGAGWWKEAPSWTLLAGLVATLVVYEFCSRRGYVYHMGATGPREALLRLAVALLEEGIRCAPLVLAAAWLARSLPGPGRRNGFPLLLSGALLLGGAHLVNLPGSMVESVLGVGAFLVGWGFSGFLGVSKWATLAGLFSFGVYLVHQVFLELIQLVFPDGRVVGVLGTLVVTTVVYLLSMVAVGMASRGGSWVRRIFGLR